MCAEIIRAIRTANVTTICIAVEGVSRPVGGVPGGSCSETLGASCPCGAEDVGAWGTSG